MTLKQLYNSIVGDYDDVVKRLISEELVSRFVVKFVADDSFSVLNEGMRERDAEKAFRGAHTLKGVAQNLGFTALGKSAAELTEVLRGRTFVGADELFEKVKADYENVISAIKEYVKG